MQRRELLKIAAVGGMAVAGKSYARILMDAALEGAPQIHTVLLLTKCHFDAGFSMTQAKVLRMYFDVYFPAAMRIAAERRLAGADGYVWTTGSWLLYEYLEQATPAQRKEMEAAIAAGDIAWHGLPFSWQTEMMDRTTIEGGLGFSAALDRRFGRRTIGAKMTDVPGHTRGIIAPLAAAGIRLLDIGVNAASTPPDVPDVFLWRDAAGKSLAMLYHRHDYGSVIEIPNSGVAVDVEVRGDNSGPHTAAEIAEIYARLRARFPGAQVRASNMNEIAAAVDRVRDQLPVVTAEIGDSWIYGCASDPYKVARYREVARLRKSWIGGGKFASGDDTDRKLLGKLLLAAEHTWGTDTKTYLDTTHYRPDDLAKVLHEPGFAVMEFSWKEKRDNIDAAVASLPDALRAQVAESFQDLRAVPPSIQGMSAHDVSQPFESKHITLRFDSATGALVGLRNRRTGREWASVQHPIGLFTYQTLSAADYAGFLRRYLTLKTDWAPRDFGKPGIEQFHAASAEWHPRLKGCWTARQAAGDRVVLELGIADEQAGATGNVAWPRTIFMELFLPSDAATVELKVITLGKVEDRMPEAMWLTFAPADAPAKGWSLEKAGERVDPLDVVRGGGRAMHAISGALRFADAKRNVLAIESHDAPVVAVGRRSPLNFSLDAPDLSTGVHFSLFNNAWGTNYPQWCGGDWLFRFRVSV